MALKHSPCGASSRSSARLAGGLRQLPLGGAPGTRGVRSRSAQLCRGLQGDDVVELLKISNHLVFKLLRSADASVPRGERGRPGLHRPAGQSGTLRGSHEIYDPCAPKSPWAYRVPNSRAVPEWSGRAAFPYLCEQLFEPLGEPPGPSRRKFGQFCRDEMLNLGAATTSPRGYDIDGWWSWSRTFGEIQSYGLPGAGRGDRHRHRHPGGRGADIVNNGMDMPSWTSRPLPHPDILEMPYRPASPADSIPARSATYRLGVLLPAGDVIATGPSSSR